MGELRTGAVLCELCRQCCRRFRTRQPRWSLHNVGGDTAPQCDGVVVRRLSIYLAASSPGYEENSTCVIWSIPGSFRARALWNPPAVGRARITAAVAGWSKDIKLPVRGILAQG
jgi:hypothetical protein